MPLEEEVEVVDYRYLLRLFFPLSTADVELESILVAVAVEVEVAVVELMVVVVVVVVAHGERFDLRSGYLRVCGQLSLCDFHLGTLA